MGLEAREAAAAAGAQAFAATSPANSAAAGAVDRAEQCQCSGLGAQLPLPRGLAPASGPQGLVPLP